MAGEEKPVTEQAGDKAADKITDNTGDKIRPTGKCAVCGRPVEVKFRPFCSQRCQQLDLGRWLGENYRIAAENSPNSPGSSPGGDDEE